MRKLLCKNWLCKPREMSPLHRERMAILMDCGKVGNLILHLRKENGYTQKKLADALNISDKTISKWERGLGCPDVSLLRELSEKLGINIEGILSGTLEPNDINGGNMKKVQFYVCPTCGNIITASNQAEISCCGRKLAPLAPQPADTDHKLKIEELDGDWYVTFPHEMKKQHYLSFFAYVSCDRVLIIKLYPEQGSEVRIPRMHGGKIYFYCSQHGFWVQN